jgi:VIT1/CCC1 family predicted Fe2+/Mn2+ transporter
MSRLSHSEIHMVHRIGWLRAAVLGANDGLVSTASSWSASPRQDRESQRS